MKRALDTLFLLVLSAYILTGVPHVPFHGDESTQVFMSRDFAYQFLVNQPELLRYADPSPSATEQELRLLNGTISKYSIGLAWHLAGFAPNDLNEQWDWGAGWDYNQTHNHAPGAALLQASRWPSALFLVVGLLALFALAVQIGGRPAAYVTGLLYALHPALLLNGRRAMMEGSLVAFSTLTALAAVGWLQSRGGRAWLWALLFGLAAGMALASKHTALLAVIPIGAGALGWALFQARQDSRQAALRLVQMALAAVLAAVVFYALNPAWWGDPLARVREVLRLRADLLAGQTAAFGGYTGPLDALNGFLRQMLLPAPQYFEAAGWDADLAPQIAAYESSGLAGLMLPDFAGAVLTLWLVALGLWALWRGRGLPAARWIVGVWVVSAMLGALLVTPIGWQRYYLPLYPSLIVVMGVGGGWLTNRLRESMNHSDTERTGL
ncbi:MAG TPA: phospholipid carrier-dependent glycosyltransferase [Candidatus Limnocylindrales bacterium]|nr:phospholipid carrier-dependent glycosyltransferase [Candidatus Limnocylindrales bacterium]